MTKGKASRESKTTAVQPVRRSKRLRLKNEKAKETGHSVAKKKKSQDVGSKRTLGKTRRGNSQTKIDSFARVSKPKSQMPIKKEAGHGRLKSSATSARKTKTSPRQSLASTAIANILPASLRKKTKQSDSETKAENEQKGSSSVHVEFTEDNAAEINKLGSDSVSAAGNSSAIESSLNRGNKKSLKSGVLKTLPEREQRQEEDHNNSQCGTPETRPSSGTGIEKETVPVKLIRCDADDIDPVSKGSQIIETLENKPEVRDNGIGDAGAVSRQMKEIVSEEFSKGNNSKKRRPDLESVENTNAVAPDSNAGGESLAEDNTSEPPLKKLRLAEGDISDEKLRQSSIKSSPISCAETESKTESKVDVHDDIDHSAHTKKDLTVDTRKMSEEASFDGNEDNRTAPKQMDYTESKEHSGEDVSRSPRAGSRFTGNDTDAIVPDSNGESEAIPKRLTSALLLTESEIMGEEDVESTKRVSEIQSFTTTEIKTNTITVERTHRIANSGLANDNPTATVQEDLASVGANNKDHNNVTVKQLQNASDKGFLKHDVMKTVSPNSRLEEEVTGAVIPDSDEDVEESTKSVFKSSLKEKVVDVGDESNEDWSVEFSADPLIFTPEAKTNIAVDNKFSGDYEHDKIHVEKDPVVVNRRSFDVVDKEERDDANKEPAQVQHLVDAVLPKEDATKTVASGARSMAENSGIVVPDSDEDDEKLTKLDMSQSPFKKEQAIAEDKTDQILRDDMLETRPINMETEGKTSTASMELTSRDGNDVADTVQIGAHGVDDFGMNQEQMEDTLRLFDLDTRYGPFVGIDRSTRWERARRFGMSPPLLIRRIINYVKDGERRQ